VTLKHALYVARQLRVFIRGKNRPFNVLLVGSRRHNRPNPDAVYQQRFRIAENKVQRATVLSRMTSDPLQIGAGVLF